MDLLGKLKCKNLSFLDQFAISEKLEKIAVKLNFSKIMINRKTCFIERKVCKDGIPLVSKRKKYLRFEKFYILIDFTKKKLEKEV